MKKISLLGLLVLQSATALFSQEQKTKPDTMRIIIGGENISLPVPKEGNKTTINLEDSASIIQISVAKTGKNKVATPAPRAPKVKDPRKRVSWLNEVEVGMTTIVGQKMVNVREDYFFSTGFNFTNGFVFSPWTGITNISNNRATVTKMKLVDANPGFSVGFSIMEKSRPIRKSNFYMITGSRFRYSRFAFKLGYDIREIKATSDSGGMFSYFPDSVYSVKTGERKAFGNSFSFLFPFLVEKALTGKFKIAVGVNVGININSSKYYIDQGSASEINSGVMQFQPIIKASINKTSFYFSYNMGKTMIGYGETPKFSGNVVYFGLAHKLY